MKWWFMIQLGHKNNINSSKNNRIYISLYWGTVESWFWHMYSIHRVRLMILVLLQYCPAFWPSCEVLNWVGCRPSLACRLLLNFCHMLSDSAVIKTKIIKHRLHPVTCRRTQQVHTMSFNGDLVISSIQDELRPDTVVFWTTVVKQGVSEVGHSFTA